MPTLSMDELGSLGAIHTAKGLFFRLLGYGSSYEGRERLFPLPWETEAFGERVRRFCYRLAALCFTGVGLAWLWYLLTSLS